MTVRIREYRPEQDWDALCRIHDAGRPLELAGSFDPRAFIPLADDPEHEELAVCEVSVAEVDGEVVGFVAVDPPYLAWLYVQPERFGHGIGRALLRHGLARLGPDAWALACGNNRRAIGLYESEGFVVESRFEDKNAGYPGPSVRLALDPAREGWTKPKASGLRA